MCVAFFRKIRSWRLPRGEVKAGMGAWWKGGSPSGTCVEIGSRMALLFFVCKRGLGQSEEMELRGVHLLEWTKLLTKLFLRVCVVGVPPILFGCTLKGFQCTAFLFMCGLTIKLAAAAKVSRIPSTKCTFFGTLRNTAMAALL